jgi:hypothetical protein
MRLYLLFWFQRGPGFADLVAAGADEYVLDHLFVGNEDRSGPCHLDLAGVANRRC